MATKANWDIMISYHHASGKEYMKRIKESLLKQGYSVWTDEDHVYGDLGARMAEGVAGSELIILLLSKGYEESKNCQKEYNLACAQHKKIICVIVEKGYKPPADNVLSLILGNNMYYQLYRGDETIFQNLLKDISQQLLGEAPVKTEPILNFWMYKDKEENIIVKFHNKNLKTVQRITIQQNGSDTKVELKESSDFYEEMRDNKLVLTIYKAATRYILKLVISLLDIDENKEIFEVDNVNIACAHKYYNKESKFSLHTHNSDKVAAYIKSFISTPVLETDIQLLYCGEVHEKSRSEYLRFSRNYVNENCTSNNDFLKEAVQFPPPMVNEEISSFAFRLKLILSEIRHVFVIFTHYNTTDNLKLLNFNTYCDHVPDYKHRLLLLHPSQNTFVNIRYTKTTSATIIQEEFQNGEVDIKHLFAINRQFILDSTSRFINVVAAPNFPKLENIDVCANCQLLDQSIFSDDSKVRTFFVNLELTRRYPDNKIKEQYMNILGQAMCFMASRETMNTVPTIKDDIHGKICTVLLSSEQSNILFNESKKKIIVGPLGSGKSVLALSHLKHLCQCCEGKCIIYYVIWSDKTILLNAVEEFVLTFQCNKNITLKVKNAIELAKELNLSKLPTLSQLLLLLLKNHGGMSFHFISDEVDGAMFDKQEALLLKQILEREEALQNSIIVLFLQSLEKHRRLVSSGESKSHDKYKYEEAGMRVFYLNKAMRTTKKNFNFLVQFEKKISGIESVIKHPVHDKNHETSSAKSGTTSSTIQENSKQRKVLEIKNSQVKSGEESKKIFEEPVDIEEIAAVSNYPGVSEDVKTLTKVKCNSAQAVGHNIEGRKPILIHLNYGNETEEKSIVMLALSLEYYLDRVNIKRLFFHNTVEQMITFRKVLDLIGEDYFVYNKQTEWNIIDRSNVVTNLPKNKGYDLITNVEGSRGTEFCETVCCIDINDTMLRHKTLEGMSRVTERLIIVCACNIQSAAINSSTGHIIKDLLPEYLNEVSVECCKDSNEDYIETQVNDRKSIGYVNTNSCRYKSLMERIKKIEYKKDESDTPNFAQIIRKNFQPPTINVICNFSNDNSCTINWNEEGYRCVIEMENDRSQWQNIEHIITFGGCVINNLVIGNKYKFRVLASNDSGQAQSVVSYRHVNTLPSGHVDKSVTFKDIVKIIKSNDLEKLKKLLSIHPNIVHMRDEHEYTPLMWTVFHTDNTSMVEILISYGSDVWAGNRWKENSYHYAAYHDRHTRLDMLCRHDVTNINRVDVNNRTPLHRAAALGNISCVDVLLRHENIDVTIEDGAGRTAYDVAGRLKNEQKREIIRRKIKEYEDGKRR
ncbi:uncharacterized protein LOC130629511 [Hydractinia symbiolongicarpus]|uniref:uncharacterized protein LOC130629511 n=1 Tax=Hydractinia symbiolongicarpus TaxID=13093 RepID=UPI00254EF4E5|nr:uncharacterized protein LOC130629511 [Hydractinia symbiolongicarpus]XP_057298729.1 uncharacterized protein LOC130629511 [Hydractinia symbiolongicarpus]XP_057298730.1 uncharacterized protein LOC130629511 [Hydractinia symbiolongicarpus]XP_057298731.1 uncharacterized protein LOC130629511 [Hydractinia symbiolongicarpus]